MGGADLSGQSDVALLDAHAAGDPDAFAVLVRRHQDRAWAVALRTLGNPEDAADAVQEAFLTVLRGVDGTRAAFRGQSQFGTWLYRVVTNTCLDVLRQRARRPTVALDVDAADARTDPAAPDPTGAATDALDLDAALRALPEPQRAAVVLVDLHDLPLAQVAEILGVPEGTVKSRAARGRVALGRLLRPAAAAAPGAGTGDGPRDVRPVSTPVSPALPPEGAVP